MLAWEKQKADKLAARRAGLAATEQKLNFSPKILPTKKKANRGRGSQSDRIAQMQLWETQRAEKLKAKRQAKLAREAQEQTGRPAINEASGKLKSESAVGDRMFAWGNDQQRRRKERIQEQHDAERNMHKIRR